MKINLTYDDVLIVPQYSEVRSRSDVDISTDLGKGIKLRLPIISSPMDTVSEADMASEMSRNGGLSILHRYCTINEQLAMLLSAKHEDRLVGAATGVTGDYLERAKELAYNGCDLICVDVAHGHHILVKEALAALKANLPENVHLMAGNVATLDGLNDLADWGADSVRANIGSGAACSTKIETGHGVPGLATLFECAKTDRDVKIIADGGIRNAGDIVKALAAGADAVMVGSILAGTNEAPGRVFKDSNGLMRKEYRGMASASAQHDWRAKVASNEGVSSSVPMIGKLEDTLYELERGIRSGFSYSGAFTLKELQQKAKFIQQTRASMIESAPHILTR